MQLNIKLHKDGMMPKKAHEDDACFDCFAREMTIENGYVKYMLGFSMEIPKGYCALIFPRSSISNKPLTLCNSVGCVDSGYKNEWQARMKVSTGLTTYEGNPLIFHKEGAYVKQEEFYQVGDRVCQFMIVPVLNVSFRVVEDLGDSERGMGGFGSSDSHVWVNNQPELITSRVV